MENKLGTPREVRRTEQPKKGRWATKGKGPVGRRGHQVFPGARKSKGASRRRRNLQGERYQHRPINNISVVVFVGNGRQQKENLNAGTDTK